LPIKRKSRLPIDEHGKSSVTWQGDNDVQKKWTVWCATAWKD